VAAAGGRFCVSPELDVAVDEATLAAGLEPLPAPSSVLHPQQRERAACVWLTA
jgi:hypothetical protein